LEAEGLFEDLRDVRTYRFQLNLSPYAEDDFECVEHIVYFGENDMGGARSLRAGVEAFSKQDQVLSTEATETQEWPHKLQAYESCLASLAALKLDAVGLAATFKPLLKTLSNRASVIDHTM